MGLACQPAPETAVPEAALSDVSTATPHPEAGLDYVPGDLLVFAAEEHGAAALGQLFVEHGLAVQA